jgi:hypothetical protein
LDALPMNEIVSASAPAANEMHYNAPHVNFNFHMMTR